MHVSEVRIENFRAFGEAEKGITVRLQPGLTALVGENDSGKTAIIDALRIALGTRDQELVRVTEADFHLPAGVSGRRSEIRIRLKLEALSDAELSEYLEYLTYEVDGAERVPVIYLSWRGALLTSRSGHRRYLKVDVHAGSAEDGPTLDPLVRSKLSAAYLRPLRDAQRALAAGRGSRLSQILLNTQEIRDSGVDFTPGSPPPPDLQQLSVLGIGDLASELIGRHPGVAAARDRLNSDYLQRLELRGDQLVGEISVSGASADREMRLRVLLEKLDLELGAAGAGGAATGRGLGSSNLLFMACELLLLGGDRDELALLLVEEPEAHLHPQRQLRLIEFLRDKAHTGPEGESGVQIVMTTHSPNLAAALDVESLVLIAGGRAYPLARGETRLRAEDYQFLARFLDVTKANLFFTRGLIIVEGTAEAILLPTLARILDRDFTASGISVVNVGGTGLHRFARVLQRAVPESDGLIPIRVACLADMDVRPNCAPYVLGQLKPGEELPKSRRWKVEADFSAADREHRRSAIRAKAEGQNVRTFVSDYWTFEYDLALAGLGKELFVAARLAKFDEKIAAKEVSTLAVIRGAVKEYLSLERQNSPEEELACRCAAPCLGASGVSKATTAQYLAALLVQRFESERLDAVKLRARLPKYLVDAIDYVVIGDEAVTHSAAALPGG